MNLILAICHFGNVLHFISPKIFAFQLVYGSMGWQTYSTLHPDAVQEMCGRKVRLVEELPRQLDGKKSKKWLFYKISSEAS